jgi:hypothetical protein
MRSLMKLNLSLLSCMFGLSMAFAQAPNASKGSAKKDGKVHSVSSQKASPTAAKSPSKIDSSKRAEKALELPLAPQELSLAEQVHVGHLPCELGASVQMTADANAPGYFDLQGKGYKYRMRPVATHTGAIRLEDEKAGAVWLQLANKSMLMDQKKGRRLADECAHPDQVAVANDMKVNPPPALIDVSNAATSDPR